MGKWRRYRSGDYSLGQLHGEAVVVWRDGTGRHRVRLGVRTEVEGRSALDAFARKRSLLATAQRGPTIADLYDAYKADRAKDGKLIANFAWDWKALAPRFGKLRVGDVTADLCRQYAAERMEAGKSAGTVWTELTRLRSCLNWAAKRDHIDKAPYVWVPTKPAPRERVLTREEVARLLDGCIEPHVRLFTILALTTGGRSGALLGLTWDRVDFIAGTVNLWAKPEINPLTKAVRKSRAIVPMSALSRTALAAASEIALSDHVVEYNGEPIKCIRKGFTEAVRRAGLGKEVTPHILRHTAASWMLNARIPLDEISRYLGHRDTRTTELIYAKHDPVLLQRAADVIDLSTADRKSSVALDLSDIPEAPKVRAK